MPSFNLLTGEFLFELIERLPRLDGEETGPGASAVPRTSRLHSRSMGSRGSSVLPVERPQRSPPQPDANRWPMLAEPRPMPIS